MGLVFKDPAVQAKYESDFIHDPVIEMGGCSCMYKGPLSGIPLVAAEKLEYEKSNLVRLKTPIENP
jgi:hypothetical protein